MGFGEVFTKPLDIIKNNPRIIWPYLLYTVLVGAIVLIPTIPLAEQSSASALPVGAGVGAVTTHAMSTELHLLTALWPVFLLVFIISLFISPLLVGMYFNIAEQGYQKKIISMKAAMKVAKANFLNMLLVIILIGIIWCVVICILAAVFLLPVVFYGLHLGTLLWLSIGALVSIVASVLLSIYLYQAEVIVILEKRRATDAIKRSIQIGKQKMVDIFAVEFITFVIIIALSVVISLIILAVALPFTLSGNTLLGTLFGQVVNLILGGILSSWAILIPPAFYKEYISRGKTLKK